MRFQSQIRFRLGAALVLLLAAAPAPTQSPVLLPPPSRVARRALRQLPILVAQNRPVGPGLQQWMEQHRSVPPAERERALQNDPSFRALNPQQQQRALNQLRQLQGMTPQQLNRRWALLRMTPQQQQQFSAVVQQYAALPPPRQLLVQRSLTVLRRVPLPQRQTAMATYPPLRQLSPYERQVLANLLFWEPYLNAGEPSAAPNPGP